MMDPSPKVCICGGGNIGHSLVAAFARYEDVSVLTRRPDAWAEHISCTIGDKSSGPSAHSVIASSDPAIVAGSDLVIIALPRFAVREELDKIAAHLREGQSVALVPAIAGVDDIVSELSLKGVETIAFQRVPFISRIEEYGRSVKMGAVRAIHKLMLSNTARCEYWSEYFSARLGGKVEFLNSFLTFTFSNSNPLLHPSRLVELLQGGDNGVYTECPYFYAGWGDVASELYYKADKEMHFVIKSLNDSGAERDYESVFEHYEVGSIKALTEKIRSISAFKTILAPWTEDESGLWHPDFTSRYFTEDVPYGTKIIQGYARKANVETPTIDYLVEFITNTPLCVATIMKATSLARH